MGVLAALLRERARVAGSGNPDGLLFDSCADRLDELEKERDALRADLDALVAALPRCEFKRSAYSCPDAATRLVQCEGQPGPRLDLKFCDGHSINVGMLQGHDLDWAPLVRRLGEKT